MTRKIDDHSDNAEEVLIVGSGDSLLLDDDPTQEAGKPPAPRGEQKLVVVKSKRRGRKKNTPPPVVVTGESGSYIHAPEEGGLQAREAEEIRAAMSFHEGTSGVAAKVNEILGGETSSGSARLEEDLAKLASPKMERVPVSFWKQRTVQAIAALGLLGTIGVGAYEAWKHFQASPDGTEDLAKLADPAAVDTTTDTPTPTNSPAAEESAPVATLYDEVGNKLETKTAGTDLSQGAKARIHATSINNLTESLYEGAKQWETLDGQWLDTPQAHANVVKKLTTWGGYQDVLTVSAHASSIDEMLEDIADSDLPHSELVAWKVATQIASIKDGRVVPSVEEVKTRLGTVDSAAIDKTLDENIKNPPPIPGPSFFLESSLYDAPEPVSLLAKTVEVDTLNDLTADLEEEIAPRFEDRFDAIEPAHIKSVVQAKPEAPVVPVLMDPTEAAEPVTLLAKREVEIPDVTEFLEEEPVPPPAPKPAPNLIDKAKSALSSLTSRFKSWLS